MSRPKLYDDVVLTRDIDEHGLKRGDVATFIDTAPHPQGGPDGLILEVADAAAGSLGVVIVQDDDIRPLSADDVPTVRQRA